MRGLPVGRGDQGQKQEVAGGDGQYADLSHGQDTGSQPDWGWGATVDLHKKAATKTGDPAKYEVSVLVMCKPEDSAHGGGQHDSSPAPMANGVQVATFGRSSLILGAYPGVL